MLVPAAADREGMAIDVRRPGQLAEERVRAVVRARRRRVLGGRLPWVALGLALTMVVFALVEGGAAAWFAVGAIAGSLAMALAVVLAPGLGPERTWAEGSAGERATAAALAPLEREGWRVEHDVQTGYGNLDHVVESPGGRLFLLESKNLAGTLALEGGVLTQRFDDDPLYVRRLGWIASRVRGQAAALADGRTAGGVRPWVQGVVVLWGSFAHRPLEADRVWYVPGDALAGWLRSRA